MVIITSLPEQTVYPNVSISRRQLVEQYNLSVKPLVTLGAPLAVREVGNCCSNFYTAIYDVYMEACYVQYTFYLTDMTYYLIRIEKEY